eukprot:snap_masked-scaffold_53-processed-gene-1.67-mRNA-1 protein AED:1.00 eAED:1.00 QI:0/0/0/0/1/1/2/0/96
MFYPLGSEKGLRSTFGLLHFPYSSKIEHQRQLEPLDPIQVQSVHQLCEFISSLERSIYIQFSALLVMSQNMIVISFCCNLQSAHFILSVTFFFTFG